MTPVKDELSRRTLMIAIGVCAVLLGIAAGAAIYFERHHDSVRMSSDAASAELQKVRQRFAGQAPLVDMSSRERAAPPPATPGEPIHAFHTMILDTRGGARLVHISAPVFFARLFAHRDGRFRWLGELTFLDDTEFDPEPIQLSFDDIRRRGPGLLVDFRHAGGGQFIAWVE